MMTIDAFDAPATSDSVTLGPIAPAESGQLLDLLARGMRDNPVHLAAFGEDPAERARRVRQLFAVAQKRPGFLDHLTVARSPEGTIVGVYGAVPPGECQPGPVAKLLILPALLRVGFGNARRVGAWLDAWSKQDPPGRHWHIGPVAVDAHLQGQGIGSVLMRDLASRMDAAGEDAYLETDKAINVRFYEKFGFEVVAEREVLGIPNWFMLRKPHSAS
jgi:ribosomal protein S18 acetylase RimI-like enzyme